MHFRNTILFVALVVFLFPLAANAHASPLEYVPASGASLLDAPKEITIRFSERLDTGASAIKVVGPSGEVLSGDTYLAEVRTLAAPIEKSGVGSYQVTWSVVSADDGHFTRGSYEFSIGGSVSSSTSFEVIQLTTTSEAFAMTIELLGNGLLWAVLLLFLVVARPLKKMGEVDEEIRRGYSMLLFLGVALVLLGAFVQIVLKSGDLALVREISFLEALPIYLQTTAGLATLYRILAVVFVGFVFLFGRAAIWRAKTISLPEILMFLGMCGFVFFRAIISHASANSFFPEFSIAINFVHLIEKDLWSGVLFILILVALSKSLQANFEEIVRRIFLILAINLAVISITAAYIVWLHLESLENLFTTNWGGVFQSLLIAALFLVALRTYHVFIRAFRPHLFASFFSATLAAEFAFALLVVHYSSVVIITSPPIESHAARSFDAFAAGLIGTAFVAVIFSFILHHFSRRKTSRVGSFPGYIAITSFLCAIFFGSFLIDTYRDSRLSNPYKARCESDGNMWHLMLPMKAGVPTSDTPREGCMWGMGDYMYMFPDREEYEQYASLPNAEVMLDTPKSMLAGVPAAFKFTLQDTDGTPAELFMDMEKLIHVVIVSEDQSIFAHIHPDDTRPLTQEEIDTSTFNVSYTFPKAGRYLISADYAHGLKLESKQSLVDVRGSPTQNVSPATYKGPGTFGGYEVSLKYETPFVRKVATLRYTITKDGKPVTNLEQYLSAAMHISAVKNDLTAFVHTHGEVHLPGTPYPPVIVKNGQVVHSMAMMAVPERFGPNIETHLIFPTPGLYTVWGEFKVGGKVIPTAFTVRVE